MGFGFGFGFGFGLHCQLSLSAALNVCHCFALFPQTPCPCNNYCKSHYCHTTEMRKYQKTNA